MAIAIVIMGVSGSGKTSIGRSLSEQLGWHFHDGDDFHSPENISKMSAGIPLNDVDRTIWLERLNKLIFEKLQAGENLILACSALKENYRQLLRDGNESLVFIFLDGDFDLIWERMKSRQDHYMRPEMLKGQFEILEPPQNALKIEINRPVPEIVQEIIDCLVN